MGIEIKRDLKPLPDFDSMTNQEYQRYVEKKKELKLKQNMNKLRKQQEREKLVNRQKKFEHLVDFNKYDDDSKESLSSDDDEVNKMKSDCVISSFDQRQMRKERYLHLQKSLNSLDHKFAEIYCCPQMIDLKIKRFEVGMSSIIQTIQRYRK